MIIFQSKDYQSREALEKAIKEQFGLTTEAKQNCEIKGTTEDLKRLKLSAQNTCWGVKCVETDAVANSPNVKLKVQRGKIYKSSLRETAELPVLDIKNSKEL